MTQDRLRHRIDAIIQAAITTGIQPADDAVLRSMLGAATEDDIASVLDSFFDVELITSRIYDQFVDRGSNWNQQLRTRLVEALFFCGLDTEADNVMASLT